MRALPPLTAVGLSLCACHREVTPSAPKLPPEAGTEAAAEATSGPATGADEMAPVAAGRDFEDEFQYGGFDAGSSDAAALSRLPGYESYGNGRFGFVVDVPRAFTPMPEPENGDGRQWRLGNLVVMTASGMYALDDAPPECASTPDVTGRSGSKSSCWATGKRDGFVFWQREVVARGVLYSLRLQYAESLKGPMDAIVTHVNASWSPGQAGR